LNIQQYISSGIIENYVLGLASSEEAQELERLAAEHPEVQAAIDNYQASLEQLADLYAVQPPADLKTKIWESLSHADEGSSRYDEPALQAGPGLQEQRSPVSMSGWKWLAAACLVLLIGSATLNWIYFNKYRDYKERYDAMAFNQQTILADNQVYKTRLEEFRQDMHIMMAPSMKPVVMQGVKTHPGMMATVYWDQNSKDVYMVVNNLPAPPSGKQYQLWAIIDGKPVSAGLYDMTDPSKMVQKMKNIQGNVQTFAITLEQKGGSSTPTLDQMYVAGNV